MAYTFFLEEFIILVGCALFPEEIIILVGCAFFPEEIIILVGCAFFPKEFIVSRVFLCVVHCSTLKQKKVY